jgi:predicted nucleic acid-binding protein
VRTILEAGEGWISAPSWLELRIKLDQHEHRDTALAIYEATLAGTLDITREVAEAAFEIRKSTQPRVPLIDSLIAGTARVHGVELLHRDSHLAAISTLLVKQRMLPAKK